MTANDDSLDDQQQPAPGVKRVRESDPTDPGVRSQRGVTSMLVAACLLWLAAILLGGLSESLSGLPREAFMTLNGQSVDRCIAIKPDVPDEQQGYWCTVDEVLGPERPEGIEYISGDIMWSEVDADDVVVAVSQPATWFAVAVGASALLVFGAFARATGTVRAGIAASVSIVFLGLLLFPAAFTGQVPLDLRTELVSAWKWVIAFYFGSEAAVQAWKVARPDGAAAVGDLNGRGSGSILG